MTAFRFRITHLLKYKEGRDMVLLLLCVVAVIIFGVLGYELIEGWRLLDALYMTIITLATVGFMEVHPLSDAGRWFTIVIIILGVGVFAVALTTLARHIVERQFFLLFEKTRMEDLIGHLKQHTIICGFGRLGRIAAEDFKDADEPIVIVEKNAESVKRARDAGYLVVEGDATVDSVLIHAGIERARALVALLPTDSDNLYVVLTSRELKPDLLIVSRTEDEHGGKRLRRAGADKTVSPYREGGEKIASALLRPFVTDFIDRAVSGEGRLRIEEIKVPDTSPLCGVSLQGIKLREKINIIIAAMISPEGEMLINPVGDTLIQPNATLIVLGDPLQVDELEKLIGG